MNAPSLYRTVHVACLANPETPIPPQGTLSHPRCLTAHLYRGGALLFLYAEWRGTPGAPMDLLPWFPPQLCPWPGLGGPTSPWAPMVDVFHFSEPRDEDHWRRSPPADQCLGRIAFLRPEKVASYVYYHYQLQEERAFDGGKYEFITLLGTMLFQYKELPVRFDEARPPGSLTTRGTPADWTQTRMDLHFQPWPDGSLFFRDLECLTKN